MPNCSQNFLWIFCISVVSAVFPSESVLHTRWPKHWSFSFSISPFKEYSRLISFQIDWFHLCVVQWTLNSILQHHSSKASILWHSDFFMVQLRSNHVHTYKVSKFSTFLLTLVIIFLFSGCGVSTVVLICLSLITNDVEHFFVCLSVIYRCLKKYLIISFAHLSIGFIIHL